MDTLKKPHRKSQSGQKKPKTGFEPSTSQNSDASPPKKVLGFIPVKLHSFGITKDVGLKEEEINLYLFNQLSITP
jgi:hypothetical protein